MHDLQKLWEELEAENEGVRAPSVARWLGGASALACFREGRLLHSSAVVTVLGVAVVGVAVAARLCKQGVRLAGLRHEVEPFEEARPDAFCSRCCAWGHVAPQYPAAVPRCALCGEDHQTSDHRCPVEGCWAKRGQACAHVMARCRNFSGPHLHHANVCQVKREARRVARGWRPPSPPRRERRASTPHEDETPEGLVTGEEGEMEVEMQPGAKAGGEGLTE